MSETKQSERYVFNGINGLTGEPLLPPMELEELEELFEPPLDSGASEPQGKSLGLGFGMDPAQLDSVGWTIVFAHDESEEVRRALEPLIEHRRADGGIVRVLTAEPDEGFGAFMDRHGVYAGEITPENIGYYLLIVGPPERIGWEFQFHADIEYAVGRLAFSTPDEYARYASSIIKAETEADLARDKQLIYWGPRHDRATELSHDELLLPLIAGEAHEGRKPRPAIATQLKWESSSFLDAEATKANFLAALERRPALLFTASHGIGGFRAGTEEQLARQGALLSADWGGPGSMAPTDYVAAADIPDELQLGGMIAFHFACYGAGTPERDSFRHREGRLPPRLAKPEFVAALPMRMLAHPQGSALAVIAHVDRAWGSSFHDSSGRHIGPFRTALGLMMTGQAVGHSVKNFNDRYAVLSNQVTSLLEKRGYGQEIDASELARAWLGRNDAQNYVVLGDPFARLSLK